MVVSEGAINNIMGGMENTAGVRLHSHRHKLKQRFDIIRKLGQGTYGKVQLAINKETGQEVAIKTIKKAKIETEQDLVRIRREIQIMSSVQHPQIIHIYEVFENREKMVLVMEYAAGGELYDYLSERKVLSEPEARRVFRQVASAVYYCHKHKICHRDLKLENILLDLDGNAKIADFGLSNVFDEKRRLDTFCGSPLYASPEIVKGTPYIGPEVDCWSLGVLLYTLVYGAMPFDGSNFRRLVKQITQGDFYEPTTPANASELIRHMLTVQSIERATVEDICSHWWVNETYSESCLTEAEALASQTPVRLDLLLSLAPKHISSEHLVIQPDDEDLSQRSDSSQAPPVLQLPPPPPMEVENGSESIPARSHSLGSLPPGSRMDIDDLLDKKRMERKADEDKKRRHEETSHGEKKKKKDSVTKKPPSRPNHDEAPEKKKSIVKEEDEGRKKEEDNKSLRKRESSIEKDVSEKSEKKVSKKAESSVTRKPLRKKESKEDSKAKPSVSPVKIVSKPKVEGRGDSKVRGSSTSTSRGASASPTPSTDATLKASDSSISRVSVSPVKIIPDKKEVTENVPNIPNTDNIPSQEIKKPVVRICNGSFESDTDKVLQQTAAIIQRVEKSPEIKGEQTPPSLLVTTSVASTPNSVTSSQATTPARSRTGSESSNEARPSRSDSSRRQSKIFSKAAIFDNMVQGSKSPPPAEKPKKITRPGALNMSDLAKKFEEKQSGEKKSKVVAPFKVSDARKAFEAKADKSMSEISPRRKVSAGNSSGGDSQPVSPRDSVTTSPRASFPTSPRESLPTSPRESLPASPMESLPTSPTRGENSLPTSPSESTTINKIIDIFAVTKSSNHVPASKESSPVKEKLTSKKETPVKRIIKSPPKEIHVNQLFNNKKEKSPMPVSNFSIKKEKSPSPIAEVVPSKPTKILSISKVNDTSKRDITIKEKPNEGTEKLRPVYKTEQKVNKDTPTIKTMTIDKQKDGLKSKVQPVLRVIDVKVDTSDSSDSESEAEKLLKFLSEKRERLELAKKEKLKKVSESREKEASARDMPAIKEEPRTTPPSKSPEKSQTDTPLENKEKCATLPRGFKSQGVQKPVATGVPDLVQEYEVANSEDRIPCPPTGKRIPIVKEVVAIPPEQVLSSSARSDDNRNLAKINLVDDSKSSDNQNKKSQVEIVFNTQPSLQTKSPVCKPLQTQNSFDKNKSFTEIHISTPVVKEPARLPEYRTEVRHTVCSPEARSAPHSGVEPQLHRAKRERIIPIMLEEDSGDEKSTSNEIRPPMKTSSRTSIQPSSSSSSKASSASSSMPSRVITSTGGSHFSSVGNATPAGGTEKGRRPNESSPELLRKSRRERIIPIAVEGEGILTPPRTNSTEGIRGSFQRQGSGQTSFNIEKEREVKIKKEQNSLSPVGSTESFNSSKSAWQYREWRPLRNNSRGRGFMLDRAESFSSAGEDDDEDEEDGFQILTAESLFSTLLNRVRSLTRKMTDEGTKSTDRMRRTAQPSLNDPTQPGGFWSSLYSLPRDSPARRISETLSRAQSREDSLGGFASPTWGGSTSKDGCDAETVLSESSNAPFSTLPRGWRSRQSGKEGKKEQEPVDVSPSTTLTPNRRQFYSRTLSRDLPLKPELGNISKAQTSSSMATTLRASLSGKAMPKFDQVSAAKVTTFGSTKQSSGNIPRRPHSTAGSSTSSGEVLGMVGGQYEQHDRILNFVAPVTSPSQSNILRDEKSKGNESVQQLKDLVRELETGTDETLPNNLEKETNAILINIKEVGPISQQRTSSEATDLHPQTKLRKSFTSFQNQESASKQTVSTDHNSLKANVNILQPNCKSGEKQTVILNHSLFSNQMPIETSSKETFSLPSEIIHKNLEAKNSTNQLGSSIIKKSSTLVKEGSDNAESFSKSEFNSGILTGKDKNHYNSINGVNLTTAKGNNYNITANTSQRNDSQFHPAVSSANEKNGGSKSSWYVSSSFVPPLDQTRRASTIEKKNFLTVEPYRRGKSEDLKAAIELANRTDPSKTTSDIRPHRRSKSKDITPAIEAASERFTQLNSSTLKKISPFEAYRRSKSRELGAAIDQANSINSIYRSSSYARTQSPPPSQNSFATSTVVPVRTPFERAKTSIEYKFEKARSPVTDRIILGQDILLPSNISPMKILSQNDACLTDNQKCLDKQLVSIQENPSKEKLKETEKPKSVYKILTSKFTRSLSNLGEDSHHSPSAQSKEAEVDTNERDEKFKLKRPSRFLKTKEKSSSRSNINEIENITEEDEMDKNEKKATSKLSSALNKFLGRKPDDIKINKLEELSSPQKSTSAAVISEKVKKPPRFRAKKFSKSQEFLNKKIEDDEEIPQVRAKSVFPEDRVATIAAETDHKENFCSQNCQQDLINVSLNDTISKNKFNNNNLENAQPASAALASYGISPALASRCGGRQQQLDLHLNRYSSGHQDTLTLPHEKKYSSDFSEDGSITPTDLEDIKENEDESVMDRITRKSYYTRFNEVKRKPKIRKVDSKEAMDQQLAAAKARLKQDEINFRTVRESLSPTHVPSPTSYSSIPSHTAWEGVTRRVVNKAAGPRTTSLPPDEGLGYYKVDGRNHLLQSPDARYRNITSPPREDLMMQQLRHSVEREEPFLYHRSPSAPLQDHSPLKRQSMGRDDLPNYRRLSAIIREDPPSYMRQSSTAREEPHIYHRLSSVTREEPPEDPNSCNWRLSSVPREDTRLSQQPNSKNGEVPTYHTLQYRKPTNYNDEQNENKYTSPYVSESGFLPQKNSHSRQSIARNDLNDNKVTASASVDSNYRPSSNSYENNTKETNSENALTAAIIAGKAAGSAAAAVVTSGNLCPNIPSPAPLRITPDLVAVMSAREELTRRLTPLTRLSNMGGAGESTVKPYRRTVTSSIVPNSLGNSKVTGTTERQPYKRTLTLDLPTIESRPVDYSRLGLQDPSRRFSGIRSSDQQPDLMPALYRRSSFSPSSYSTYVPSSASYSSYMAPSYTPPSMNTILRRNALFRY